MRSVRLTTCMLLSLVISVAVATPTTRQITNILQRMHAARQIESTTPVALKAKTGYPATGFRPRIPFELPNERKQKKLPDVPNTPTTENVLTITPGTSTGDGNVNVYVEAISEQSGQEEEENIDSNGNTNEIERKLKTTTEEPKVEVHTEMTETEVETRTPAIEYGPPEIGDEKIKKPAVRYLPPIKDAVDFLAPAPTADESGTFVDGNSNNNAAADTPATPVANLPTPEEDFLTDVNNSAEAPFDISSELEAEAAGQHMPAKSYGPPIVGDGAHLPAETYSAPGVAVLPPEMEEEDFGEELSELEAMKMNGEANLTEEQIDLLSGLSELRSGRLIFVPSDGGNLRQIFFAASPQQGRA